MLDIGTMHLLSSQRYFCVFSHHICFWQTKLLQQSRSYKANLSAMKKLCYDRVAPSQVDQLVVFYYQSSSEMWPDKRGGLCMVVE